MPNRSIRSLIDGYIDSVGEMEALYVEKPNRQIQIIKNNLNIVIELFVEEIWTILVFCVFVFTRSFPNRETPVAMVHLVAREML